MVPADAPVLQAYVRRLGRPSRHNRFLGAVNELPPAQLARLTSADRPDTATLLAEIYIDGTIQMIGEAPYAIAADGITCEFAISIADDWQRRGIGTGLLAVLTQQVAHRGVRHLVADALQSNQAIRRFAQKAGFSISLNVDDARLARLHKTIDCTPARAATGLLAA